MKKLLLGVAALATLAFTSCSDDDDTPSTSSLTLDISGLENLGDEYRYEGWIILDDGPVSTGTFSVDDSGALSQISFPTNTAQLAAATNFVLSIEPNPDNDPAPAATKILMGAFNGNSASVNSDNIVVDATSSLGTLGASSGKFILATPTDMDDTNEDSGVWFLDNSSVSAAVGLQLPTLSAGWKYEGWAVINGTPVSTGTFTDASMADDNAATSPFKGTDGNGPGYPGEDYLNGSAAGVTFPTSLKGATIVISVEPSPDNSTAPFTLKPLAQPVAADADVHTAITMGAGPVAIISGSVSR
ncbi:hypothetical protein LPB136_03220 [Tenacibaculum todarodis]|uniref:Anti-sigma factor n=1 Tax=Tenacibaculum todarodis TaxID=1850252 RepID=A0A1L3JH38_9FLAO|nr:anti-sigma factor [Tenacibaculum todarodis]APG64432.1 hypothetical protein LPB136_03220 [Tenacibaculum todarodis]